LQKLADRDEKKMKEEKEGRRVKKKEAVKHPVFFPERNRKYGF